MRLLIVTPRQERACGNWVTASRFAAGLTARGHTVTICETDGDPAALAAAAASCRPQLALLLHAWRSGRPWLESGNPLPYAVLLTGTDVSAAPSGEEAAGIAGVLRQAGAVLSQNPTTVATLRREQPDLATTLHYLPPGFTLGNEPYPLRDKFGLTGSELLLLCPAGIRPVKGVLELLELCTPLAGQWPPLRLVFCGPELDTGYSARFRSALGTRLWAAWAGVIPPAAMAAALRQADLVLNHSYSEGLPNALVEAAALGRPIVARDIPGNAAVVTDGHNGLLYRDDDGFLRAMRRLLADTSLRRRLARPDPGRFSAEREAAALEAFCVQILAARRDR